MEGTRHEKVALIVTAYIIGFTTAFIAFGLAKMHPTEPTAILFQQPATAQAEGMHTTSVALSGDGLYSITREEERLLSANKNVLDASVIQSKPVPGFYEKIVDAEASRDGRFVYYCEQLVSDAENCNPYVYALQEDALYPVKKDDAMLYPIITTHESLWTNDSTLVVNGAISRDPNRPWELYSEQGVVSETSATPAQAEDDPVPTEGLMVQ